METLTYSLQHAAASLETEHAAAEQLPRHAIRGETYRHGRDGFLVDRREDGGFRLEKVALEKLSWFASTGDAWVRGVSALGMGCAVFAALGAHSQASMPSAAFRGPIIARVADGRGSLLQDTVTTGYARQFRASTRY